ncbi:MAG: flippase-like domain-containing protein [Ruminococcus sp.]|nr:flippase-like domain-containing protein [Ruminococcus sp.]
MAQQKKTRNDEKSQARAERRAEKKAENEKLYQEVMAEYSAEEVPAVPEKPKSSNKLLKRIGIVLFVILNAAVIYFTASSEFSKKAPAPIHFSFTNILFLLGGILCLVVVLGCETVKYMLMMRHLGEKVSFRHAFSTAALGKYYDCITPSGAGGQPFQIYYLHSNGYSDGAASAMPLSGFFTMQFGFVILCIFAFIFGNWAIDATGQTGIKITAYFGAVAYTIVPVMIIISGVAPKIAMRIVAFFVRIGARLHIVKKPNHTIMKAVRYLNNYSMNIKLITKDRGLLIKLLILSTVFQTAMCSMPFFAVRTFDGNMNYFQSLFLCIFIQAAISLIMTPGNSGAAEGSFYLVFSSLSTAGTFWAMLIWRFLCYYSFIVIGLLIYGYNAIVKLREKRKAKQLNEKAE